MNKIYFLFVTFLTALLFSCSRTKDSSSIIAETLVTFPQLKKESSEYNLVRKVTLEKPSLSVKLYSTPQKNNDFQQILVITNANSQSFAIPLFSNTYREYWDFEFDSINPKISRVNTTFEKEFNNCMNHLGLNDTVGTASIIAKEIIFSVLHCREIRSPDSAELHVIRWNNKHSVPQENSDSCFVRINHNWKLFSTDLNANPKYKHSYWDEENGRIYQFDFRTFMRNMNNQFKISVFRSDCDFSFQNHH